MIYENAYTVRHEVWPGYMSIFFVNSLHLAEILEGKVLGCGVIVGIAGVACHRLHKMMEWLCIITWKSVACLACLKGMRLTILGLALIPL